MPILNVIGNWRISFVTTDPGTNSRMETRHNEWVTSWDQISAIWGTWFGVPLTTSVMCTAKTLTKIEFQTAKVDK